MRLKLVFTKKEVEALREVVRYAEVEADALMSDNDDEYQAECGRKLKRGAALIDKLIDLARTE